MMERSESVTTPAKDAAPPRRRCLDPEYKRQHGCADKWDLVLFLIIGFLLGMPLGIVFVMG